MFFRDPDNSTPFLSLDKKTLKKLLLKLFEIFSALERSSPAKTDAETCCSITSLARLGPEIVNIFEESILNSLIRTSEIV